MSYSKLIHDYLDGELEQTRQEELFAEIAQNPSVRTEFNQQIKIHLIAQSDMATITPPLESTNAIFSTLGFKIPSAGYVAAPVVGNSVISSFLVSSKILFQKFIPSLFMSLVTSAITVGVMLLLMNKFIPGSSNNFGTNNSVPVIKNFETVPQQPQISSGNSVPDNHFTQAQVNRMIQNAFNNYFVKFRDQLLSSQSAVAPSSNDLAANIDSDNENLRQNDILSNPSSYINSLKPFSINNVSLSIPKTVIKEEPIVIQNSKESDPKFSFTYRTYSLKSNPEPKVGMPGKPWFSDMGVGLMYNLNKNHSFGLEFGQEQFAIPYDLSVWGSTYNFYGNPYRFWYGAIYRYTMDGLFTNVIAPYGQVFAGGSSLGPIAKGQLGIQYQPVNRVSFNLGVEGSILYYNVNNNIYNVQKMGYTFGLKIGY